MSAVGTRTPFPGFARPHSVSVSIPRCRPAFPPLEIAKARRLAQYGRRLHRQKGAPRRGGCRDTVIFRLVDQDAVPGRYCMWRVVDEHGGFATETEEIGRASCRERVCQCV